MNIPYWAIILVYVMLGIIAFCIFLISLFNVLLHFMHEEINPPRRVLPIERIRREQSIIEMIERVNKYEQDQAVEQIKNSVILINPNETIEIGLPKKSLKHLLLFYFFFYFLFFIIFKSLIYNLSFHFKVFGCTSSMSPHIFTTILPSCPNSFLTHKIQVTSLNNSLK